ncbi:hypothetical protein GCM10023080_047280 [Streptomyces pseudoechinosporeus]
MLALTSQARRWEPRRLRFRLFSAAGQLVTTGRRRILRLARHWPWTAEITTALELLVLLPTPADQRIHPPSERAFQSGAVEPGAPETTLGPSAFPQSAAQSETARRLYLQTVTKVIRTSRSAGISHDWQCIYVNG